MDKRRSEFKYSEKWDKCIENGLAKVASGAAISGILSFLLFRRGSARIATFCFGTGIAAGISYSDCRLYFENPNTRLAKFHVPQLKLPDFLRQQPKELKKAPSQSTPAQPSEPANEPAAKAVEQAAAVATDAVPTPTETAKPASEPVVTAVVLETAPATEDGAPPAEKLTVVSVSGEGAAVSVGAPLEPPAVAATQEAPQQEASPAENKPEPKEAASSSEQSK